jgi:hypothetical protein
VVNFSQKPNAVEPGSGGQNISFATSIDMINWEWQKDNWFEIDTVNYHYPGRWDCIAALPVLGTPQPGPLYGFWTGSPKGAAAPWGFGRTDDGLHWEALPAPQLQPPLGGEIGGVESVTFGGSTRYYAMVGNDRVMYVYSAANITGPYIAQTVNHNLLSGHCYFARSVMPSNRHLF